MKISQRFPDFLIIGAGKSGTTSLDNYLKQHPGLYIPSRKEPNFFGYETVNPDEIKIDETREHYYHSITKLEDYLTLFNEATSNQKIGETSNIYLYGSDAFKRIKRYAPGVKLIAIFRQPAERVYSRYLHLARENKLPTERFEDLFDRSTIWWQRPDLIEEGFYYKHLSKFYSTFSKSQIGVFLYEDLRNNPYDLLGKIYEFLEVDSSFKPDMSVELNKSGFIKDQKLDKIVGSNGAVLKSIKSVLPNVYSKAKSNKYIFKWINNLRNKNLSRPSLSAELKKKITDEIYSEDLKKFQDLVQIDIKHWF